MFAALPPVFAGLTMEHSQEAAGFIEQVDVPPGEAIMIEGEGDATLAFIVAGSAEIWMQGIKLGNAGVHDMLGEMELFYPTPRLCSVTASNQVTLQILRVENFETLCQRGNSLVFQIERAALRRLSDRISRLNEEIGSRVQGVPMDIAEPDAGFLARLSSTFRRKEVGPDVDVVRTLDGSEMFGKIPPHLLSEIAKRCEVIRLPANDEVCAQGEESDAMWMVAAGEVEVVLMKDDEVGEPVGRLSSGHAFGESGLALGSLRSARCITRAPTTLLELARDDFMEFYALDDPLGSAFRQGVLRNLVVQLAHISRRYVAMSPHLTGPQHTPLGSDNWR